MAGEPLGWSLLLRMAGRYRAAMAAAVLAGLFWTAAKVAVPSVTRAAIDHGVLGDDDGAVVRWALLILAIGAGSAVMTGLRRWFASKAAYGVEADIRAQLHDHLVGLHPGYFDRAPTGNLMSRASSDLQQVQGLFMMIPIGVSNAVTVLAVTAVLLATDLRLALLSLAALPLLSIVATRFSRSVYPVSLEVQQELASLATVVEETVSGIRVVKGFGAEAHQAQRLRGRGEKVYEWGLTLGRIRSFYTPLLDLLPALGLVGVLWGGGHAVLSGRMSLGTLVAFNAYVLMLVWPLRMTGYIVAMAQRAAASAHRLEEVLSTEPLLTDPPEPVPLPAGGGRVTLSGVAFRYAEDQPLVLEDLDLTLEPGEAVALVGPTGSGKSTIARLLARAYDVTSGSVSIDGVDVREMRLADVRRAVATVPEDTFLFSDSVRDNIAFARPGASDAEVRAAAELAGAHTFVAELPDGYDTVLGERGHSLSGGQRQRIALARAILADPRVLVLDDATSAVDPSKEHEIRGALATAMEGRTTLVIAHRPATIALADRVVLLDTAAEGGRARVVAEGTHEALLATSPRYREVLARTNQEEGVGA